MAAIAASGVNLDARADVVMPPPDDCPAGSLGATSHAGPYCRTDFCPEGGACRAGTTCQPRYLCVVDANSVAPGECSAEQSCTRGTCELIEVCYGESDAGTPPADAGTPDSDASAPNDAGTGDADGGSGAVAPTSFAGDDGGCGCRAGAGSGTPAWAALALLFVGCTIRRRRPRILG